MSPNFAQIAPERWGSPPWQITFTPAEHPLPSQVDFAVIGAGFSGLAAAAWLRLHAPEKSVAVFESGRIGRGASGRTGGMTLAESAAGDLPGLGDVLAGLQDILARLDVDCDLSLPGAWEIARKGGLPHSPISWNDSGTLRAVAEVPGGTLDPGKLVTGLARAAERLGARIFENRPVRSVRWGEPLELEIGRSGISGSQVKTSKVLFATNALSPGLSGLDAGSHPKLTLAVRSAPIGEEQLRVVGLSEHKPFYTVDFPYLWGRTLSDRSIVWGAGLVDAPPSGDLQGVDIHSEVPSSMFAKFKKRVYGLHPALASLEFTHEWGGPILFRDDWQPVFDWHPKSRNAIVLGAFAGHGVALSNYLGAWAAEILLGRRQIPEGWGRL
jgi:glycine/D-amino acid oxidase-like deaminating enzyme